MERERCTFKTEVKTQILLEEKIIILYRAYWQYYFIASHCLHPQCLLSDAQEKIKGFFEELLNENNIPKTIFIINIYDLICLNSNSDDGDWDNNHFKTWDLDKSKILHLQNKYSKALVFTIKHEGANCLIFELMTFGSPLQSM